MQHYNMNTAEATNGGTTLCRSSLSDKIMAVSGSSSSVAGLHGGRVIDLTSSLDLTDDDNDSKFDAPGRRRCHHGAVMDDGRAYTSRMPVSTATASATAKVNKRPIPKQRGSISIIDLANSSSSDDSEDDDGATKKRSLQRNNNHGGKTSGLPQNSYPIRKRTRTPQLLNKDSIQQQIPTSLINIPSRRTRDGATVTFGLLSLIDLLKDGSGNTLTCEGSLLSSHGKLYQLIHPPPPPLSLPLSLPFNHQPFHYMQNDNWGCGFRNLQMLISSMMPSLSPIFPEGVPSVEDIQRTMEVLWRKGFDLRNAEHHKHSLVGKQTWIGTVEVWSYLSFKRVDSIIVQFIKTKQNRAMLGPFVWSYFSNGTLGCSCNHNNDSSHRRGSAVAAKVLLKEISKPNHSNNASGGEGPGKKRSRCNCSLPPLYLQWDGHSVTVVGVKRISNSQQGQQDPSFNLVIFCPQKNAAEIKIILAREFTNRQHPSNEQSSSAKQSEHYEKSVNSVIELPVSKLQQKDCQILLSTTRIIDEVESNRRKSCTKYVGFLNAEVSSVTKKVSKV